MRIWIDTDVGTNPDDTVALWCAAHLRDADLVGVSTVDGDVQRRAEFARRLLPEVDVVAGPPTGEHLAGVDALVAIGPWTHIAQLADQHALPLRVVLMGGVLGTVKYRGAVQRIEHNVSRDPAAAAHLLHTTGNLIVVPLDSTVRVRTHAADDRVLAEHIPGFGDQLAAWKAHNDDAPLVLHDPATLLVAMGEKIARMESRRLVVESDGRMLASVAGPLQRVVAFVNADATRARVRALASRG